MQSESFFAQCELKGSGVGFAGLVSPWITRMRETRLPTHLLCDRLTD